ncbi:carnitine dehydratase [Mycobacterium colombiense]|uniref:Carnitine dehydratase n=1 Tax=Mycobacterium colombiense TaxID=339268 RepID=A0A329KWJ7_9MYCO|nr:CoA transferase [Mycobacterium colombiense]RAU99987.1 carnitine dehydratase [Mycobacterium colombiense]
MTVVGHATFLSGVRVLQLGDGIAGSAAVALLADLGADATKVAGRAAPARVGPVIAAAAGPVAAIDLTLDRRKQILEPGRYAPAFGNEYDIVIVDHGVAVTPPTAEGAVVVMVTPFGLYGPRSSQPGGELVAQAAGGMLATIEGADGAPVPAPGYVALKAAGAVTALAALHGLDRRNLGRGSMLVDVSVQEAVAFTAALPECAHVLYGCPGRAGSGRYLAPSGLFPCRDGMVRITAVENHQWRGLLAALDHPAWARGLDERQARIDHADLINRHVTAWAATHDKEECAATLQAHGVPSTPVNAAEEILTSPQFAFRGTLSTTQLGGVDLAVLDSPWLTDVGRRSDRRRTGRLSDLRVAELTHVLAGPIIGALLGAMGAKVLRLEDPQRLDIYRRTGPFARGEPGVDRGAYFAVANHSKQSLLIDPARTVDDVAMALSDADVLIENVGNARLARLEVDPAERADSGMLVLRVSGFGSEGPMAGYRVYANNVQAYGGLAGLTVGPDGAPARLGTVIADPLSSVVAAAVVAAWAVGPSRDTGAVIDLSMAEVVASTVAEFVAAAAAPGGCDVGDCAHRGVYRAADGRWVAVEIAEPDEWERLTEFTAVKPHSRHPAVVEKLADMVAAASADDVAARLSASSLRAAPVQRAEDLVVDPHLAIREFFPEIAHPDPDIGTARLVGLPWRFAGQGPVRLMPPPALGNANAHEGGMTNVR